MLRVAILGAPGTGKSALVRSLQAAPSRSAQWRLHRNTAEMYALELLLLQSPNEAKRSQCIAAHLLQPFPAHLILLTALLPTAPGSGNSQRELLDRSLRQALTGLGLPYSLLMGEASARCLSALQAIDYALGTARADTTARPWTWSCEKCSDPDCEHRLFSALLSKD